MNPKEKLAALLKKMTAIAMGAKASNHDLRAAEMTTLEAQDTEADALRETIERGAKWLTSGTVNVPSILSAVTIEAKPRTLLDLVPVVSPDGAGLAAIGDDEIGFVGQNTQHVGNGFSFVRQIVRKKNAGAVPDLDAKPASEYTFQQVGDTFRV